MYCLKKCFIVIIIIIVIVSVIIIIVATNSTVDDLQVVLNEYLKTAATVWLTVT